jgi:hypothetical protein
MVFSNLVANLVSTFDAIILPFLPVLDSIGPVLGPIGLVLSPVLDC